jgi:hypothetical protein
MFICIQKMLQTKIDRNCNESYQRLLVIYIQLLTRWTKHDRKCRPSAMLEILWARLTKIPPHIQNSHRGLISINYLFPEWIKKGLDKILGTLHPMGSLYVWYGVTLEPLNHISTLMSSTLDLWPLHPKFNTEHLPSMGSSYVWYGVSKWRT